MSPELSAAFAAVFVPNFILQAIARAEPELRAQPLAILEGHPPHDRAIAINRLAELLGVTPGMSKASAGQFGPLAFRARNPGAEEAAHAALLDAAWSVTPRVESFSPDTLLLDLSGLGALFGRHDELARRLAAAAATLGMSVQIALSGNVETARIVARALPGPTIVPAGEERRFLETLPVGMLCPSQELADVFARWGISTCKELASLPVLDLSEGVGQEGVRLHAIACGGGQRPLLLTEPAQRFEESLELEDAVEDLEALSFLLGRILDQLAARVSARALSIAVVHTQFELQPSFENAFDTRRDLLRSKPAPRLFPCTLELPVPTRDAKLLLKLLRLRLQAHPPGAPVQKIHMAAESSLARVTQGSLFVPASPDPDKLELTIARIAAVVGEGNVGSPRLLDSHRPDAFCMERFAAAPSETRGASTQTQITAPALALHLYRPPLPARVQLQQHKPVSVTFQGRAGKVLHASGPWRSCGEWWEEKPWQEDAWDLEIHFFAEPASPRGLYRFAFDGLLNQWFVRGMYD